MNTSTSATMDSKPSVVIMYINLLVPPILVILGVTFNWFTILTMRTRYFRKVSTSVYLKVGAFNDLLALLVSLISHWLYVNFPSVYVRTSSSHLMCKFFNFYGSGNNDFGIIVTVSMTAERALVIASPLGAGKFCSVARAWKVVLTLLMLVIVKNCHYLIASDIVPVERTDRLCDVFAKEISDAYNVFNGDIWPWVHLFYVVSCGIVILISNSIILHNVRKSFGVKYSGRNQAWRHLVPMLLGESLLLVIFTFPFTFHLALLSIRIKYNPDLYLDENTAYMENLVFSITFYMLYSNKCVNFFMYCITGKQFRDGLVLVLMRCACQEKHRKSLNRSAIFRSTTSGAPCTSSKTRSILTREEKMSKSHNRTSLKKQNNSKITSASERLKISLCKKRNMTANKHTHALSSNRPRPSPAYFRKPLDPESSSIAKERCKVSSSNCWANSTTPHFNYRIKSKSHSIPPKVLNVLTCKSLKHVNSLGEKGSSYYDKSNLCMGTGLSRRSVSAGSVHGHRSASYPYSWFKSKWLISKLTRMCKRKTEGFPQRKRKRLTSDNSESVTADTISVYVERMAAGQKVELVERTQTSVSVYL